MNHHQPHRGAAVALLAALGVLILFVLFAATCDRVLADADDWARYRPIPRHLFADLP